MIPPLKSAKPVSAEIGKSEIRQQKLRPLVYPMDSMDVMNEMDPGSISLSG
jgi:hypothetical protein